MHDKIGTFGLLHGLGFAGVLAKVGVLGIAVAGCSAPISDEAKMVLKKPVNCATAEGDHRVAEKEKAHVGQQAAAGQIMAAITVVFSGSSDPNWWLGRHRH